MRPIFVMIKCEMGQSYQVARMAADTIEELSELFSISGQYNLLAKFYLDAGHDTGLFVTERVQTLPGSRTPPPSSPSTPSSPAAADRARLIRHAASPARRTAPGQRMTGGA